MALHRTLRRFGALASTTAIAFGLIGVLDSGPARADGPVSEPTVDERDAELQAAVLAAEDRRLIEIRTITSLARWQGKSWKTPYRLGTATGYTLVLTPRSEPYTVEDLLQLAPQTFLRMSDGSYLLSEHIVVVPRAQLRLSSPGGLTLRLASSHRGFATIVSLGGEIEIGGEEGAPVAITSWDVGAAEPDQEASDGRAYLRAIGGQFVADHVEIEHLGFWSGRSGGLALTGTDRPNTGAIESSDLDGGAGPELLDDITWQPAGELGPTQVDPNLPYEVPALDYVSSRLSDVTVRHSAFGLFVSGANGLQVSDSLFTANTFGGVVLHRYVTNGVITRTTSSRNAGHGFTLNRATTDVAISEATATENAGSGFRIAGRALAEGPSAVGASLRSYGNNSVSHSTATDNGHYGIEVVGGFNVGLSNNRLDGQDMGIMVSGPAERVSVTGNVVRNSDRHGIALVNGVGAASVTGNVVEDASTGVYLRDSAGEVRGNTIQDASAHGVSFVGEADGSDASFNVLAGRGESALDLNRAHGDISTGDNNLDGWHDTTPWYAYFKKLLQPMTALWSILAVLIVTSAVRSRRNKTGANEHPYAHQMVRPARAANHGYPSHRPSQPARPGAAVAGRSWMIDLTEQHPAVQE